jgi:hypothetical protein
VVVVVEESVGCGEWWNERFLRVCVRARTSAKKKKRDAHSSFVS